MFISQRNLFFLAFSICCLLGGSATAASPPDLQAHWVQGPSTWYHGQPDHISIKVLSVGGAVVKPGYDYRIYLSKNKLITSGDLLLAQGSWLVLGVHAVSVTLPATVPAGTWYYGLIVPGVQGETNLANNTVASVDPVVIATPPPDVTIKSLAGPAVVNHGGWADVTFDVANVGGPLQGTCGYRIQLSDDQVIEPTDPIVASGLLGESNLHATLVQILVPSNLNPATYHWTMTVFGVTGETHTADNNLIGGPCRVEPKPDLEATSISGPSSHKIGLGKAVAVTINSLGGIPAEPGTYRVSLREAGTPAPATIDLAQFTTPGAVATSHVVFVEQSVPAGHYFWVLRIIDLPGEQNTSNNEVVGNPVEITQAADLVAVSISGPDVAELGGQASVNIEVQNLNLPLNAPFIYEIRLSANTLVTQSDPLVASFVASTFGPRTHVVTLAESLPQGKFRWALRIPEVPNEPSVINNFTVGNFVSIGDLADLEISQTRALTVCREPGSQPPADFSLCVRNAGGSGSVLYWGGSLDPAVPWLTVAPNHGSVVGTGPDQEVVLSFQTDGLPEGTYETAIHFANSVDSADTAVLPVVLRVGAAEFLAGDVLVGALDDPADRDEARFFGLKGMVLKLELSSPKAGMKLAVRVASEGGGHQESFKVKAKKTGVKKTVKLPESGWYTLSVEPGNGKLGPYVIATSRKLPKAAGAAKKTVKVTSASQLATLKLRALPGATLDVTLRPLDGAVLPPKAGWSHGGLPYPFHNELVPQPNGSYRVTDLSLSDGGDYDLWVTGFEETGVKWKIEADPAQPAKGDALVLLP